MKPPPKCAECGSRAQLVPGSLIHPRRHDLRERAYWLCACGAYVGCHLGTDRPLGTPAGPATRAARQAAHGALDPLWRLKMKRDQCGKNEARSAAYKWLAGQLGVPLSACHIGRMDQETALRVVEIVRALARAVQQAQRGATNAA